MPCLKMFARAPSGKIGDLGDSTEFYALSFYVTLLLPNDASLFPSSLLVSEDVGSFFPGFRSDRSVFSKFTGEYQKHCDRWENEDQNQKSSLIFIPTGKNTCAFFV